jgi:hypothetical protein
MPCARSRIVKRRLFRPVGNAGTAAEVDELDPDAGLLLHLDREFEEDAGGLDVVVGVQFVRGHHGVQAEAANAFLAQAHEAVDDLLPGEAVLGLLGLADDDVAVLERARVVAAGHQFGQAGGLLDEVDVADVVEVDHSALATGGGELLARGLVRGQHDFFALHAHHRGQDQLGNAGAIGAETLVGEDLEHEGIGQRLDCIVLVEVGENGEGLADAFGVGPDRRLVVKVEGSGVSFGQLAQGRGVEGEGLFIHGRILTKGGSVQPPAQATLPAILRGSRRLVVPFAAARRRSYFQENSNGQGSVAQQSRAEKAEEGQDQARRTGTTIRRRAGTVVDSDTDQEVTAGASRGKSFWPSNPPSTRSNCRLPTWSATTTRTMR